MTRTIEITDSEKSYLDLLLSLDAMRLYEMADGRLKEESYEARHSLRTKLLEIDTNQRGSALSIDQIHQTLIDHSAYVGMENNTVVILDGRFRLFELQRIAIAMKATQVG